MAGTHEPAVGVSAIVCLASSAWVRPRWRTRGRSAVGSASPCQGEGRGFESRRPLSITKASPVLAFVLLPLSNLPAVRTVAFLALVASFRCLSSSVAMLNLSIPWDHL